MLQDLTTDTMGMSVLSDGVTLESLVQTSRSLEDEQLKQCVKNAIRNALYRLCKQAQNVEALHNAVVLITMGDFVKALDELNA